MLYCIVLYHVDCDRWAWVSMVDHKGKGPAANLHSACGTAPVAVQDVHALHLFNNEYSPLLPIVKYDG